MKGVSARSGAGAFIQEFGLKESEKSGRQPRPGAPTLAVGGRCGRAEAHAIGRPIGTGIIIVPAAAKILVLNGPNLNLLGQREPEIYGRDTLSDIERMCQEAAAALKFGLDFRQSNHEGELVTWLQEARGQAAGIVLNAGAYSHSSIAILDALRALDAPAIEVHLSNPYRREAFRRHSYVSEAASGLICGLGAHGYVLAIEALARLLAAGRRR